MIIKVLEIEMMGDRFVSVYLIRSLIDKGTEIMDSGPDTGNTNAFEFIDKIKEYKGKPAILMNVFNMKMQIEDEVFPLNQYFIRLSDELFYELSGISNSVKELLDM